MLCIGNDTASCKMGVFDNEVEGVCLGPALKSVFQVISFLFFIAGVLGNLTFVAVTTRSYQELSSTDLFLVGLAGFDFIASIFLPLVYFLEISRVLSFSSDSACRFSELMHEVSIVLSIYVLLFTVHSFYRRVFYNPSEEHRKLRFFALFGISIFLAALPAFPVIVDMHAHDGHCHVALDTYTSFVLYDVVIFIIQVIVPIFIFTIMFVQVGVELHTEEIQQTDLEADVSLIERARNQRKLTLLLVVTLAFFVVFLPYMFSRLWFLLDGGETLGNDHQCYLYDIFYLVVCIKCFINPLVYLFCYEGFKENIKRVICGFRIGRRYNFMHVKYHFRREQQEGILETDSPMQEGHMLSEMNDWQPTWNRSPSPPNPEVKLDEKEHDYDEDDDTGEDSVAILRPWKNLRSTSAL